MKKLLCGILLTAILAVCPVMAGAQTDGTVPLPDGEAVRVSSFSGKPVPRFESLKYPSVHGRKGPGFDYQIAWKYERQGLPVVVLKESRDWRMVRDPSGDEVWMHKRTLNGRPGVLVYGTDLVPLKAHPKADARVVARIEPGVVANLIDCDGAFCEVYVDRRKGWAPRAQLWGAPGTSSEPLKPELLKLSGHELATQ